MGYELSSFTKDLDRIATEERDRYRHIVQRTEPLLKRLIADMSWLQPCYYEPRVNASVQYLLHRSSTLGYTITSVVFWSGYSTKVHDHGTWGLVGVWRGEEREERFQRIDDGTRPGYAKLALQRTDEKAEGCVSLLVPPEEEIHRIQTTSSYPSCSIHIYGSDLGGRLRHQFDLESHQIKDFEVQFVTLD